MRSFTYFFFMLTLQNPLYLLYLQYILIQSGHVSSGQRAAAIWLVATILDGVGLGNEASCEEKYRET